MRGTLDGGGVTEWARGFSASELCNGICVRLRIAGPAPGRGLAILLEPLESHEAARQADRAETELQSVLEWMEEGVVLFDAQENVRAMNTRFEQIAGSARRTPGRSRLWKHSSRDWRNMPPRRSGSRTLAEAGARLESGVREELQMARFAPRIVERASRPVLDAAGRQLGRVEIYRDLTAQRVFQSKLLQTEKLAALGQMVSGIAHELSNPLTSILGFAQRLLSRAEATGRMDEAQQIYQEAERASTILRQLLLNARETLPERRTVSLNEVVLKTMEVQRFGLEAEKNPRGDRAGSRAARGARRFRAVAAGADESRRKLAASHRAAGPERQIHVRTKKIGEQKMLLEVRDDGPGVPPAILARIFDPFFTTKPAGVGTGLGLSIVLSVVREHGGQVQVLNPPQGGAVFQIELPAAAAHFREETSEFPPRERRSMLRANSRNKQREERPSLRQASGKAAAY